MSTYVPINDEDGDEENDDGVLRRLLNAQVKPNSPADRAGLREQMIIVEVNNHPVSSPNEVRHRTFLANALPCSRCCDDDVMMMMVHSYLGQVIKHLGKPGKMITIKTLVVGNNGQQQEYVVQVMPQATEN